MADPPDDWNRRESVDGRMIRWLSLLIRSGQVRSSRILRALLSSSRVRQGEAVEWWKDARTAHTNANKQTSQLVDYRTQINLKKK